MPAFSLRNSLETQGVTDSNALQAHLNLAYLLLQTRPSLRVNKYQVTTDNPNNSIPNMG